jgi:hypothetical protein
VPDVDVLELENERYRRMTVPVTIGGEGPFRFMLDTGAQATVVSRALADRLALDNRKPAILVGMASRRRSRPPDRDFALGSRQFYIRSAPVVEGATSAAPTASSGSTACRTSACCSTSSTNEIAIADAEDSAATAATRSSSRRASRSAS